MEPGIQKRKKSGGELSLKVVVVTTGVNSLWAGSPVPTMVTTGYGDYPADRCIKHMERAFNFVDTSTNLQSSEVFCTKRLTKHHTYFDIRS
ncbi:hypothetical protein O6H91_17G017900 [Diphasiastrum complanatum]|uniref:Uncharacterized protein n=1 Tax=Diphasiastrum complanatum TaxID=34168 RepID=A0ACC2B4N4_DIPCM|nr:hypothetical protein O6H91_17G017900 [Diphasiastrum complanatum]